MTNLSKVLIISLASASKPTSAKLNISFSMSSSSTCKSYEYLLPACYWASFTCKAHVPSPKSDVSSKSALTSTESPLFINSFCTQ